MQLSRTLTLILFLSSVSTLDCPSPQQLKIELLQQASGPFIEYFKSVQVDQVDYQVSNFCMGFFKTFQEGYAKNPGEYFDTKGNPGPALTKLAAFSIKICINTYNVDLNVVEEFLGIGKRITEQKAGSSAEESVIYSEEEGFTPLIDKIYIGRISLVMIVNSDIGKFAVKMMDNSNRPDDELRADIIELIGDKQLLTGHDIDYGYKYETLESEYMVATYLAEHEDLKDFFIGICDSEVYGYPGAVIVMEYGGKTLADYYTDLRKGDADPISEGARVEFYYRMFDFIKALEKNSHTFCDLKPENLVFDPKNPDSARIIDVESITHSNKPCKVYTIEKAPPEAIKDRYLYNSYINYMNRFVQSDDVAFKLRLIQTIKNKYIDKMEAVALHLETIKDQRKITIYRKTLQYYRVELQKWDESANLIQSTNRGSTTLSKSMSKLKDQFINFFKTFGLDQSILIPIDSDRFRSHNFDIYSLGAIMLELEVNVLVADNEEADDNDAFNYNHRDLIVLTNEEYCYLSLRNYQIADITKGSLVMTTKMRQKHDKQIFDEYLVAYDFTYKLLSYLNEHVLVELPQRKSIDELESALDNIISEQFEEHPLI